MKLRGFGVLALAALLGAAPDQDRRHLGKIAWETDPSAGLAKAKAQGMAALLYFTADW